ncbi:enoyl-CoA hydratase/carnithine racemase [Bradyrhizobium japonicum]
MRRRGHVALRGITEVAEPRDRKGVAGSFDDFDQKFSYLLGVPKPTFMAINGPIAGIGLCLGLFGDFRYTAEGAKLTTAVAKRGLVAKNAYILDAASPDRHHEHAQPSLLGANNRFR